MRLVLWISTLAALAAAQDPVQVNVRHGRDWNSNASAGACTMKVWVEEDAEFSLQGEKLAIRTLAGRPARDISTECSAPLPNSVEVFRFKLVDGRGQAELVDDPAKSRGSKATVRIRDPRAGAEEFTCRLEWERGSYSGGGSPSSPSPGGGSNSDNPRPPGNVSNDTRDVSRWKTADLRQEVERIFNDVNKRFPTIAQVDDYIDHLRFDRWTFADVGRDVERRR